MNILLDTLPETITVNGRDFFADVDFRTMIIYEKIVMDSTLSVDDKVRSIISLVLTDEQPRETSLAMNEIIYLYSCGKRPDAIGWLARNGNVTLRPKLIYDFEYDAPYIYGAFLSQYGIDLNDVDFLHWWKFQALFKSLRSDCKIVEIMGYRAADLSKIKEKDERSRIRRLQEIYALPQSYTQEEKVAMAGASFAVGGFR